MVAFAKLLRLLLFSNLLRAPLGSLADAIAPVWAERTRHNGPVAENARIKCLKAMRQINPHGENGGNEMLRLLRHLDITDKHKLLIPTVTYAHMDKALNEQVPDSGQLIDVQAPGSRLIMKRGAKLIWTNPSVPRSQLGTLVPPTLTKYYREIDFTPEIAFDLGEADRSRPLGPTLDELADFCAETVALLRKAAAAY
jgi:hypothetical protein